MTGQTKVLRKKDFIQKLGKTLLVIGNGFDLYCGYKTKYSDYFNQIKEKNNRLQKWVETASLDLLRGYVDFTQNIGNRKECWRTIDSFDDINVWDVFFYLISPNDETSNSKRWCDIEKSMLLFLNEQKNTKLKGSFPSAQKIFAVLRDEIISKIKPCNPGLLNDLELLLAAFIYKKHHEVTFTDDQTYYDFLLDQLHLFERNFGGFINRQLSNGCSKEEKDKRRKPKDVIDELCLINKLIGIDTFNYGPVSAKEVVEKVRHINGDTSHPIFGVDSDKFGPADARYIFTKTYRRMILDSQSARTKEQSDFESVVVFGHSLNEADHNYFIPILDKLRITDFTSSSKIIFAFNIYDDRKAGQIRNDLVKGVSDLFFAYSKYKGNVADPNRLLDSLTTQGKVVLYEVK